MTITIAHNTLTGPDTEDFAELLGRVVNPGGSAPEQLMDAVVYTSAYYDARGVVLAWSEIGRQYVKAQRAYPGRDGALDVDGSEFISIEWSRQ